LIKHLFSLVVAFAVLILYAFWFYFLDRRLIFLYGHRHTTPFDCDTASRYWMTGLVAGGTVFFVTVIFGMVSKQLHAYTVPGWKQVWKNACLLLTAPVLALLLFIGKPPIPPFLSLWILAVLFVSLGVALYAGSFVVRRFRQSVWGFFDGLAFAMVFQPFPLYIDYGLRRGAIAFSIFAPIIIIVICVSWLYIMPYLHKRFRQPFNSPADVFLSGMTTAYLLLPLLHYLISRPNHVRYVSNSANFFAGELWIQILAYSVAGTMLWFIGKIRKQKDFTHVTHLLLLFGVMTAAGYLIMASAMGKDTDVWVCSNGQWLRQGNPIYEKPFPEECVITMEPETGR